MSKNYYFHSLNFKAGLTGIGVLSLVSGSLQATEGAKQQKKPMNVLFIAVDDLRPQLGCYGVPGVKSPNIDRLASQGMVFRHAYCQQAVSNPTRISLLTGMRPDQTKVWNNSTGLRPALPDHITLPQQFMKNGYIAQSYGKIYHVQDPQSWSDPVWHPKKPPFLTPEGQELVRINNRNEFHGIPYEAPDAADNDLKDGDTADEAIKALNRLKDKTFFLAVGFVKPHLPFVAPKRYWDMYDRSQFKLPVNRTLPEGAPQYAIGKYEEIRDYLIKSKGWPLDDEEAISLIHGYHACVSYTDAQIGKVIAELERLGLRENTVIILWGDHGWHLGEQGHWAKATNYELDTNAPLIISVPGQKNKGKSTDALVEFVDIYPSLCDICNIPVPEGLAGTSFKPLISKPGMKWKTAVFSQYPKEIPETGNVMGYTMRTSQYRLTKWAVPEKNFLEYELYDYNAGRIETKNLAKNPEYSEILTNLISQMEQGPEAARPGPGNNK